MKLEFPHSMFICLSTLLLTLAFVNVSFPQVCVACQDIVMNQPGRVDGPVTTEPNSVPALSAPTLGTATFLDSNNSDWLQDRTVDLLAGQADQISGDLQKRGSTVQTAISIAALSLAPILLLMTTCYVRLFVVLGLLRQAIGAQQLPSNQVITALSFFVTLLVMTPVWQQIKTEAIDPAYQSDGSFDWRFAMEKGITPLKTFMSRQIELAGNEEAVIVFYRHQASKSVATMAPESISDAPVQVILPAFLISELKVAFLLGFQVYLPFLVLDLVVSSLTVSMGMVMMPPSMVSLPLKLILFVMVDGWNLVIGMLLQSFGTVI